MNPRTLAEAETVTQSLEPGLGAGLDLGRKSLEKGGKSTGVPDLGKDRERSESVLVGRLGMPRQCGGEVEQARIAELVRGRAEDTEGVETTWIEFDRGERPGERDAMVAVGQFALGVLEVTLGAPVVRVVAERGALPVEEARADGEEEERHAETAEPDSTGFDDDPLAVSGVRGGAVGCHSKIRQDRQDVRSYAFPACFQTQGSGRQFFQEKPRRGFLPDSAYSPRQDLDKREKSQKVKG